MMINVELNSTSTRFHADLGDRPHSAGRTWAREEQRNHSWGFRQRFYSWIVDRFHIPTRMFQLLERQKDYDFRWLEDRRRPLAPGEVCSVTRKYRWVMMAVGGGSLGSATVTPFTVLSIDR
jgi:hypothetical protein